MKRDKRGRYCKEDDDDDNGYNFCLVLPSIKTLLYWLFILVIMLPWTVIAARCNILKNIFEFFDSIMQREEGEPQKKNGLFY